MELIGVSQNVIINQHGERLDTLAQDWNKFLTWCKLIPILLPNNLYLVKKYLENLKISGFLFTGGNDLSKYSGLAPERDELERYIISYSIKNSIPLLGVCRGMQIIQDYFGVKLIKVFGHIAKKQSVEINGKMNTVNSFHCFGSFDTTDDLTVWARSKDSLIKAVSHKKYPIWAIMWHPERMKPFRKQDINLFKSFFHKQSG